MFDLDETLLDRTASLRRFCKWQAEVQCGLDLIGTTQFVSRFIELDQNGAVWKDAVYDVLKIELPELTVSTADLLAAYISYFFKFCSAKDGAPEAVQELHNMGYKLALVSNGPSPFQERNFEALGMSACFDGVVVSDAVGFRKPDKEIFLFTCSLLGVQPTECFFVGDNPVADIQGASAVGMYTIFIPGHFGSVCRGADSVCENFEELPGIVKSAR